MNRELIQEQKSKNKIIGLWHVLEHNCVTIQFKGSESENVKVGVWAKNTRWANQLSVSDRKWCVLCICKLYISCENWQIEY